MRAIFTALSPLASPSRGLLGADACSAMFNLLVSSKTKINSDNCQLTRGTAPMLQDLCTLTYEGDLLQSIEGGANN